jgi:hypothetical protein
MWKSFRWILFAIILLALATLACLGSGGDEEAATETPAAGEQEADAPASDTTGSQEVEEPAEEQATEPPEEPAAEPTLDVTSFALPDDVTSYRIQMTLTAVGKDAAGADKTASMSMAGAYQADPPANSIVVSTEGMVGSGEMTVAQIGDASYFVMEGSCMSGTGQESASGLAGLNEQLSAENLLGQLSGVDLVDRNVEINGVSTDQYHFDATSIQEASSGMENVEGDIYVSDDGYTIRVVFSGTSTDAEAQFGDIVDAAVTYQLDYFDINEPVEITVPEGCAEAAAPPYPVPDDAFEMASFGTMVTFKSMMPLADLVTFYKDEMDALGYTLGTEFNTDTNIYMTFTSGEEEISISAGEDTDSGGWSVTILGPEP